MRSWLAIAPLKQEMFVAQCLTKAAPIYNFALTVQYLNMDFFKLILRTLKLFWDALLFWVFLLGILYAPADTRDIISTYPWLKATADIFDRSDFLIGLLVAAGIWITWMDARPFVLDRINRNKTHPLLPVLDRNAGVHCTRFVPDKDNLIDKSVYKLTVLLGVRNVFRENKTVKNVRIRIVFVGQPTGLPLFNSDGDTIDIQPGVTEFFKLGSCYSTKSHMAHDYNTVDSAELKMMRQLAEQDNFGVTSTTKEKEFGVNGNLEWEMQALISADDMPSLLAQLAVNASEKDMPIRITNLTIVSRH